MAIGASFSFTVTSKLEVDVLFKVSVATNVLVVVPVGNNEPLGKPAVCVIDKLFTLLQDEKFLQEGL